MHKPQIPACSYLSSKHPTIAAVLVKTIESCEGGRLITAAWGSHRHHCPNHSTWLSQAIKRERQLDQAANAPSPAGAAAVSPVAAAASATAYAPSPYAAPAFAAPPFGGVSPVYHPNRIPYWGAPGAALSPSLTHLVPPDFSVGSDAAQHKPPIML